MIRLLLSLQAQSGVALGSFLADALSAVSAQLDTLEVSCRSGACIENDPLQLIAENDVRELKPLHGVVELSSNSDTPQSLLAAAEAIVPHLQDALRVDWSYCSVAVGEVHAILPAVEGDLELIMAAERQPNISRGAFLSYWRNVHAALALAMLGDQERSLMGYQQLHVDEALTQLAVQRLHMPPSPFDGVLQCQVARVEDLPHFRRPEYAQMVEADERNFAHQTAPMQGSFLTMANRVVP